MAKESPDGQEKTEDPTGRRRGRARSEGNVAKSQEVTMVAGLFAVLVYFALRGGAMLRDIQTIMGHLLAHVAEMQLTIDSAVVLLRGLVQDMAVVLLPFLLVLVVVAVMSNVLQFGFLFTLKPFEFKLSKFNTIKGLKQKVSPSNLVRLLRSLLRMAVVAWVPFVIIRSEIDRLPLLMDMAVWDIMCRIGALFLKILLYVSLVLLVLAIIDLVYQRWKHTRDLKMTKQEVKDEHKQAEGDPKVKARIRRLQIELFRKSMLDAVPKADVVVTNPVHYAVALQYDRSNMDAPQVIAKGARKLAARIKEIAREHNVPVVENPPLAQSLYKLVDVGQSIPETLYKAVAEVLAYVYSKQRRSSAA